MLRAIKVMTVVLVAASMKLAHGCRITLAMMIGTVNRKVLRPLTICWGVSLIDMEIMNNVRKAELASSPEPERLTW
jgi:hypothetical protein